MGRVRRHPDDFGAVILCDARYLYIQKELHVKKFNMDHLKLHFKKKGNFFTTNKQE